MNESEIKRFRRLGMIGGYIAAIGFIASIFMLPFLGAIVQGLILLYCLPGIVGAAVAGILKRAWLLWLMLIAQLLLLISIDFATPRTGYIAMVNHYVLGKPIVGLRYFETWSHAANMFMPIAYIGLTLLSYWIAYFVRYIRPEVLRSERAVLRAKQGLCVNCAYNLEGNESGVCPECGTNRQWENLGQVDLSPKRVNASEA